MHANNYEEVIEILTDLVAQSRANHDQMGYFAALYRRMTMTVRRALDRNEFQDNECMAEMVTCFANRYLDAVAAHQAGSTPTEPWRVTFATAQRQDTTLAQHLFLGMNAHINFDLGIAAAQTVPGEGIHAFEHDFTKINEILASLLGVINAQFGQIWPLFSRVDAFFGGRNQYVFSLGMNRVRGHAWGVATLLAPLSCEEQEPHIQALEKQVALYANRIAHPMFPFSRMVSMLCKTNTKTVTETIDILCDPPP